MSNCTMQGAFSPWSWKVCFPSGRTPWSWATTVGVLCTAGQKVSRWTQLTSDPAVYETAWEWVTSLLLLSWLTWGLTRSEQGTYVPASWSDPTPSPDKWFSVLEKHTDWSPKGTEERRAPCNAVYPTLPQRGLINSGPWHQDCLRNLILETTVLRPASSLRKTKEPESAQAGPNETRLARGSHTARWWPWNTGRVSRPISWGH